MAHEIEIVDGVASMSYGFGHEVPWHGLGNTVDPNASPREWQVAAKADWTVSKQPVAFEIDGVRYPTGQFALQRDTDHHILSPNVGPDWEPVQNHEAFDFFGEFVEAGQMQMNTAGVLRSGQIVWALAKVSESFTLFEGDKVDSYLLLSTSHRYGKCTTAAFTPIRVVCANTFQMALNGSKDGLVLMNHREKFNSNKVKDLLGIASEKFQTYKSAAELLGSVKAEEDLLVEYFDKLFPTKGEIKHSKNAATYMVDHELCRDADTRLFHSWFGGHRKIKTEALTEAMLYAEAAL